MAGGAVFGIGAGSSAAHGPCGAAAWVVCWCAAVHVSPPPSASPLRDRSDLLDRSRSHPAVGAPRLPDRRVRADLPGILRADLAPVDDRAWREHLGRLGNSQFPAAASRQPPPRVPRVGARFGTELPPRAVSGLQGDAREAHRRAAVRLRHGDGAHLPAAGSVSHPDSLAAWLRGGRRHRYTRPAGR